MLQVEFDLRWNQYSVVIKFAANIYATSTALL